MTAIKDRTACPTCKADIFTQCISLANGVRITNVHAARKKRADELDISRPSRETLLAIMERAFIPQDKWSNRDTSGSMRQLGECYALIKAGCNFYAHPDKDGNTYTIFVDWHGFDWFEYGGDAPTEDGRFYCPTAKRLEDAGPGEDWYC